MIYKMFFGKHIDLDKIVAISDAYYYKINSHFVGFDIECQLLEKTIHYETCMDLTNDAKWFSDKDPYGTHIKLDGDIWIHEDNLRTSDYKNISAIKQLQKKIDEIVKVWKYYKENGTQITKDWLEKRKLETNEIII
jgi:hypothetical protein